MKDARLSFDPILDKYRRDELDRRHQTRAIHTPEEWRRLVAPLVSAVRDALHGVSTVQPPAPPFGISSALEGAWTNFANWIADPTSNQVTNSDASWAITAEVVERLATEIADFPEEWRLLFECERMRDLAWSFCLALPRDAIDRHVSMLCSWTPTGSAFDALEIHRSDRTSVEALDERLQTYQARGTWTLATEIRRLATATSPSVLMRYSGTLAVRGGAEVALRWVESAPYSLTRAVAIAWIENIAVLTSMLKLVAARDQPDELLGMLLALGALDVMDAVNAAVRRAVNPRIHLADSVRARLQSEFDTWREAELPNHCQTWAELLAAEGHLQSVALAFLRNTFIVRWRDDLEPETVRTAARAELVASLSRGRDADRLVELLLDEGLSHAALLSAALVVAPERALGEIEKRALTGVVAAYGQMSDDRFVGRERYRDDDALLVRYVAHAFVRVDDPRGSWMTIESRAPRRSHGWNVSAEPESHRGRKLEHVFVVGALATEGLVGAGRALEARLLFDEVWRRTHQWARTLFGIGESERATVPLTQAWARLPIIRPEDAHEVALNFVSRLDFPMWIFCCVDAYATTLFDQGRSKLPENVRRAASEHLALLWPAWVNSCKPEERVRVERRARELGVLL